MSRVKSAYLNVDGFRTHYLEGGTGPTLLLLHSGEFGAAAEFTWEFNIEALAEHFHVYAPDWLGYGRSAKVFSFDDMWTLRANHIRRFMEMLYIDRPHVMANSMGASMLITVAAQAEPVWPMDRIVVVSGGGEAPDNDVRHLLNSYDCSREHMGRIIRTMITRPEVRDSEGYLEKRFQASLEPGAWECTAAARFKSPAFKGRTSARRPKSYAGIKSETLLVAGGKDNLRFPDYAVALRDEIPGARLHVFEEAGHFPQIDFPDEFNRVVIDFLLQGAEKPAGEG